MYIHIYHIYIHNIYIYIHIIYVLVYERIGPAKSWDVSVSPGAFPHLGGLVEELQDHHRGARLNMAAYGSWIS